MRWGMSEKVGSVDYAEAHEGYQGNAGGFSVSAHTKEMIEQEVRELIDEGYGLARKILLEKSEEFERLAKGLLEYETLTGDEIRKVIAGQPLDSGTDGGTPPSGDAPSLTAIPKTAKPRTPKGGGLEPTPSA
jgi:cell division protease FtsH